MRLHAEALALAVQGALRRASMGPREAPALMDTETDPGGKPPPPRQLRLAWAYLLSPRDRDRDRDRLLLLRLRVDIRNALFKISL